MKPKAWSHSALGKFITCARQYHEVTILKTFADVMGSEAKWGDRVHKAIEAYIKYGTAMPVMVVPETMQHRVKAVLSQLPKSGEIQAESQFAMTNQMKRCDWFASDTWVRAIIDVLVIDGDTAYLVDWKTGKIKDDREQLMLASLLIFQFFPNVQVCKTSYEWLAYNDVSTYDWDRSQIPKMWRVILPKLKLFVAAFKTNEWPARPSGLCKNYCPVLSCEHNGRK